MDILGQSSLLVGVTSFALGSSVLSRNVRNKLFIAFAVLTTLISIWAISFFLEKIWQEGTFYRLHLFANVWLAPAGLAFTRLMVRIHDRASRRLLDLSVLFALCISVTLVLRLELVAPWVQQVVYYIPALILLQIFQLMWIDRRLRRGIKRHPKLPTVGLARRNLIYLGGVVVLVTCVMDHAPWIGKTLPAIGNLMLTAYLFFISQAISQQRLLNIGALFSRFLVLLVISLILGLFYSLLLGWIQDSPELFFLNSFIASFLILTLLDPLRSTVRFLTERLLTAKHRRMDQTLREAQRRLAGIVDLISLFQAILTTAQQVLLPEWGALFVLRGDGTKYRRVRTIGHEPDKEVLKELLADHPLIEYSQRLHKRGELPILLDQVLENEIDRSASRVQRQQFTALIENMKALDSNLLIPLMDADKILAFVTLRVPAPPEPWGNNWGLLSIVYPFFEQAAQTMRNMEIYVRQREKERLATLGEMSAGLAHEIRNPLGAIKGAAQFLVNEPGADLSSDKPESRFLRIIIEEVDRLNHVVTQFLDYSKPPTTDLKPIDLSQLTLKTVENLRPSVEPTAKIEFHGSPEAAIALAAPEQLQQVLVNLIRNSVKAVEGKVGLIRVTVESEGGEVAIQVEDNGKGIRKENIDKLFIPFFTTSPSGTGLGLSISQKIIEGHRGRIEVASEEGRFTRFSVILPKATEQT